MEMKSWSSIPW